jgi:hypothetical protein
MCVRRDHLLPQPHWDLPGLHQIDQQPSLQRSQMKLRQIEPGNGLADLPGHPQVPERIASEGVLLDAQRALIGVLGSHQEGPGQGAEPQTPEQPARSALQ